MLGQALDDVQGPPERRVASISRCTCMATELHPEWISQLNSGAPGSDASLHNSLSGCHGHAGHPCAATVPSNQLGGSPVVTLHPFVLVLLCLHGGPSCVVPERQTAGSAWCAPAGTLQPRYLGWLAGAAGVISGRSWLQCDHACLPALDCLESPIRPGDKYRRQL